MREMVTIIGGGPAGMATAIQLRRHGIDGLLLEREDLGGLLWNAQRVENYPGFPGGIPGPELVERFTRQFREAGCRFSFAELRRVGRRDSVFELETAEKTFSSDVIVVATGTRPCPFPPCVGMESDKVFYEVRPLLETTGAVVAVIGAGDAAFDYALNLARRNRVLLLNHGVRTRCLPLLFERVADDPAVDYRENTVVSRVLQDPGGGLVLQGEAGGTAFEADVDYLLCAVGREPRRTLLSSFGDEERRTLQETGRLHLVGDVKHKDFRQVGISVGDGVLTAMKIAMHLGGSRK
jgi:thioredoxin reductase (NADPH)